MNNGDYDFLNDVIFVWEYFFNNINGLSVMMRIVVFDQNYVINFKGCFWQLLFFVSLQVVDVFELLFMLEVIS